VILGWEGSDPEELGREPASPGVGQSGLFWTRQIWREAGEKGTE
jgi:hypothetical protein